MDLPAVGTRLELKILRGPFAGSYSTYVADVDDQAIIVARPELGETPVTLAVGDPLRIEYAVRGLARITFSTRVLGFSRDRIPLVRLSIPEQDAMERYQQRDFVRLDASLNLIYYVISRPGGMQGASGIHKSITRDISGNGAQILCTEPFPPGTQLDVHLEVGDQTIHTVAEVIRQVEQANHREHWIGVRFVGLDERERDTIIRFIFAEQRERRRRGLL